MFLFILYIVIFQAPFEYFAKICTTLYYITWIYSVLTHVNIYCTRCSEFVSPGPTPAVRYMDMTPVKVNCVRASEDSFSLNVTLKCYIVAFLLKRMIHIHKFCPWSISSWFGFLFLVVFLVSLSPWQWGRDKEENKRFS